MKSKSGRWGRPQKPLPQVVQEALDRLASTDEDWTTFYATDGQHWCVAKHYQDPGHFTMVASVVMHESSEYAVDS